MLYQRNKVSLSNEGFLNKYSSVAKLKCIFSIEEIKISTFFKFPKQPYLYFIINF